MLRLRNFSKECVCDEPNYDLLVGHYYVKYSPRIQCRSNLIEIAIKIILINFELDSKGICTRSAENSFTKLDSRRHVVSFSVAINAGPFYHTNFGFFLIPFSWIYSPYKRIFILNNFFFS